MPLQNRVTPLSELIATPARGLVYGNRGCLHDASGRVRRFQATRRWIACRLSFRGWHRSPLMAPGRFTELFFLDEATAFAAGHRPCALCRREDYLRFAALHAELEGADALDAALAGERLLAGEPWRRRLHERRFAALTDGAMVVIGGAPWLVLGGSLRRWTPAGYADLIPRPVRDTAEVITPPMLLAALAAGWAPLVPLLHPSAAAQWPETA